MLGIKRFSHSNFNYISVINYVISQYCCKNAVLKPLQYCQERNTKVLGFFLSHELAHDYPVINLLTNRQSCVLKSRISHMVISHNGVSVNPFCHGDFFSRYQQQYGRHKLCVPIRSCGPVCYIPLSLTLSMQAQKLIASLIIMLP